MKFAKVLCTVSNGTCANKLVCYVKPMTIISSILSVGCKLLRSINPLLTVSIFHKNLLGGKFKQILIMKSIDVCRINQVMVGTPFMKGIVEAVNTSLGGIIRECPYKGSFFINTTLTMDMGIEFMDKIRKIQTFPNGVYKVHSLIHNKRYPNIATTTFFLEFKNREKSINNDEDF